MEPALNGFATRSVIYKCSGITCQSVYPRRTPRSHPETLLKPSKPLEKHPVDYSQKCQKVIKVDFLVLSVFGFSSSLSVFVFSFCTLLLTLAGYFRGAPKADLDAIQHRTFTLLLTNTRTDATHACLLLFLSSCSLYVRAVPLLLTGSTVCGTCVLGPGSTHRVVHTG